MARVRPYKPCGKPTIFLPDSEVAEPVHFQRLKKALDLGPFLQCLEQTIGTSINNEHSKSSYEYNQNFKNLEDVPTTKSDGFTMNRSKIYNFSNVQDDRIWLQRILLESSDSEDSSDEITLDDYKEMLKHHVMIQKYIKKYHTKNRQRYRYYSSGLHSNYDNYVGFQYSNPTGVKDRCVTFNLIPMEGKPFLENNLRKNRATETFNSTSKDCSEDVLDKRESFNILLEENESFMKPKEKNKRAYYEFKKLETSEDKLYINKKLDRKVYTARIKPKVISKPQFVEEEIKKAQAIKANTLQEKLETCENIAELCKQVCCQNVMKCQEIMKEPGNRTKRLTQEMKEQEKKGGNETPR